MPPERYPSDLPRLFERNATCRDKFASVPRNDPKLFMFTKFGMVQFKNVFTGWSIGLIRRHDKPTMCAAGGKA